VRSDSSCTSKQAAIPTAFSSHAAWMAARILSDRRRRGGTGGRWIDGGNLKAIIMADYLADNATSEKSEFRYQNTMFLLATG
jgi:hypothetical protein